MSPIDVLAGGKPKVGKVTQIKDYRDTKRFTIELTNENKKPLNLHMLVEPDGNASITVFHFLKEGHSIYAIKNQLSLKGEELRLHLSDLEKEKVNPELVALLHKKISEKAKEINAELEASAKSVMR